MSRRMDGERATAEVKTQRAERKGRDAEALLSVVQEELESTRVLLEEAEERVKNVQHTQEGLLSDFYF